MARALLRSASWWFRGAVLCRLAMYRLGWLRSHSVGVPVICVGNLTTGGTGKTPAVAWVVNQVKAMDRSPCIVSRGYRAEEGGNDEQRVLEELCPGVPHIQDPDRVAGARRAREQGADVVVLDDGFSHVRLKRNLDILLFDSDVVPVGKDQKQHVELTRDLALRFNHHFGEATLVVSEAQITEAPLVPGTDGEKMSKSKGNIIPLFAPAKELKKVVMGIVTGSETLEEPKVPEGTTVYDLYRLVAPEKAEEMASKLRAGNYGWGHAKQDLLAALEAELGPMREKYQRIRADEDGLDATLLEGARRARMVASATLKRVRHAVGIDREAPRELKTTLKLKR